MQIIKSMEITVATQRCMISKVTYKAEKNNQY